MISDVSIMAHACQLREDIGLTLDEPIGNIDDVIERAGYYYRATDFGNDFSGFCRKIGPFEYLIGFNTRHSWNEGFRRFTISHELAHLTLPHHRELIDEAGERWSKPEYQSKNEIEREADKFAGSFLAPKRAVSEQTKHSDFTRETVLHLSDHFGLSYYAAATRFIETTELVCALIVCKSNGEVYYERRSRTLKDLLRYHRYLSRNVISQSTLTADFISGQTTEHTAEVLLRDWYLDLESEVYASESVIPLGYGEIYLTMLTPNDSDF